MESGDRRARSKAAGKDEPNIQGWIQVSCGDDAAGGEQLCPTCGQRYQVTVIFCFICFIFAFILDFNELFSCFRYEFDVTKSMFSAGNITEKLRVAGFDCRGETVVDLYAGTTILLLNYSGEHRSIN